MTSASDRAELAGLIRRFTKDELSAFELDEALADLAARTEDPTVSSVRDWLRFHYDDCKDHRIVANKAEWDFFQRLILLLESGAVVVQAKRRRWSPKQALAAVGLAGFGFATWRLGWGWHLLAVSIPLGVVSIGLSHLGHNTEPAMPAREVAAFPFGSVSQIRKVVSLFPGFRKQRYPKHLSQRSIRDPGEELRGGLHRHVSWLLFSPVVLLFQAWPVDDFEWRVVLPGDSSSSRS